MKIEGIRLQKPANLDIVIYTDASYGAKTQESAKSQSGAMTTMGGQLINWWARKWDIVTLSIVGINY
jgi:hypothetical protein